MESAIKLREKFQHDALSFREVNDGIILIDIKNRLANACISMQGAQVIEWMPVGHKPVIWLSEDAIHKKNKSVRGGIPVCWPWFGGNDSDPSLPAHGFARSQEWDLCNVYELTDGATQLVFALDMPESKNIWPHHSRLELYVTVAASLSLKLVTSNLSGNEFEITEALHTYFNVSDVENIKIEGLHGCDYLDKVNIFSKKSQAGSIIINEEVDRIYLDTESEVRIIDNGFKRTIKINKQGSLSTVVWNPWYEKSNAMGDMGKDGFRHMVCVETANAASNKIKIPHGMSHELSVEYTVDSVLN